MAAPTTSHTFGPQPQILASSFLPYGRRISPAGVVGAQVQLSTSNAGDAFNNVAFDGSNFLIVYTDGASVRGRFITAAGTGGQEVTIIPAAAFGAVVTVAFNGTNYLVTAAMGQPTVDAVAQLLSPAGARIGGTIGISTVAGADEYILKTVATGNDFIVSYVDSFTVVSRATVKARFVSGTGATRGPAFTVASPANGRVPLGAIFNFDGSKYLALLLRGIPSASEPQNTSTWTQADIYSVIVTPRFPRDRSSCRLHKRHQLAARQLKEKTGQVTVELATQFQLMSSINAWESNPTERRTVPWGIFCESRYGAL